MRNAWGRPSSPVGEIVILNKNSLIFLEVMKTRNSD